MTCEPDVEPILGISKPITALRSSQRESPASDPARPHCVSWGGCHSAGVVCCQECEELHLLKPCLPSLRKVFNPFIRYQSHNIIVLTILLTSSINLSPLHENHFTIMSTMSQAYNQPQSFADDYEMENPMSSISAYARLALSSTIRVSTATNISQNNARAH